MVIPFRTIVANLDTSVTIKPSFPGRKVGGTIYTYVGSVLSNDRNKKNEKKTYFFSLRGYIITKRLSLRGYIITKKNLFLLFLTFRYEHPSYLRERYIYSIRDVFLIIHGATWHKRGNLGAVSGFQLFRLMIRRKGVVSRNGISKARHVPGT